MKLTGNSLLVSVPVITYNSSATVVETLDSIFNQTYPYIELIISDDCSSDNTVEVCNKWLSNKKDRFVRTMILSSNVNNGISKNLNIATSYCSGEWIKPIAGDDLLVDCCIENYLNFIHSNPDAFFLFSKCKSFGADDNICRTVDLLFDYNFFSLTLDEQFKKLVFEKNCIPATTFFYNRKKAELLGVVNDERIPLIEDWPKWINLLKKNVKFYFFDTVSVLYRVGGNSTCTKTSVDMYYSIRLLHFYYLFPEWCKISEDYAIKRMLEPEINVYKALVEKESKSEFLIRIERDQLLEDNVYLREQLTMREKSTAYKLGKFLLFPISYFRKKLHLSDM